MTKPLPNQRNLAGLHYPLPKCYHGGNPICKALCGHGPRHRGLLHAIATQPDLTLKVAMHYQHRFDRLLTFIAQHDKCLFPPATDSSSASTPQETSDRSPSSPAEPKAQCGS